MIERSLVLIKPEGVVRNLIGDIISRFERTGLKIVGMKMINVGDDIADSHYQITDEWANELFRKSKTSAEEKGKKFPYKDSQKFASVIKSRLKNNLKEGAIVAIVFEGLHAVEIIRKLVGGTEPRQSLPGTIRGDYLLDSYELADKEERGVKNLVHASSDIKEAEREIKLWFKKEELLERKD